MLGNNGHTLKSLLDELAAHSQESISHSKRVAGICRRFGMELGITGLDLESLILGAKLHDIGKLFIDQKILHKTSKLNDDERAAMSAHPGMGAEHVMQSGVNPDVLSIILNHHERWDGQGYPNKLAGDAIPFHARIVAMTDTYDTIISKRLYDPPRSVAIAIREIELNAGTQFDPHLAEHFLSFLRRQHAGVLARETARLSAH